MLYCYIVSIILVLHTYNTSALSTWENENKYRYILNEKNLISCPQLCGGGLGQKLEPKSNPTTCLFDFGYCASTFQLCWWCFCGFSFSREFLVVKTKYTFLSIRHVITGIIILHFWPIIHDIILKSTILYTLRFTDNALQHKLRVQIFFFFWIIWHINYS